MGRYQWRCGGDALLAGLCQLSQLGFTSALGLWLSLNAKHWYWVSSGWLPVPGRIPDPAWLSLGVRVPFGSRTPG